MEKKILGLDLGSTSIGWALIKESDDNRREVIRMGCRIIPLDIDEKNSFEQGKSFTKNQERRKFRTMRRNNFRYKLRRAYLLQELKEHGMWDENLLHIAREQLWELRAKAVTEKISLTELGRVLYHLNQRRGFKSGSKHDLGDEDATKTQKEMLSKFQQLKNEGKTIGQKFYDEIKANPHYRVKEQTYPREAYMEEYNAIMSCQQKFYPEVLTDNFIHKLRDQIIFYQRPLKSQKKLVSICEFEGKWIKNKDGETIFIGPRVAPRSSPLFQYERIWEVLNNIEIGREKLSLDVKKTLFSQLYEGKDLNSSDIKKLLGTDKDVNFSKIPGNTTYFKLKKILSGTAFQQLLQFDVEKHIIDYEFIQPETGEVQQKKIVAETIIQEPLYQLWHTIYAISDVEECKKALIKKFNLPEEIAQKLAEIDFVKDGYGNKSAKAIRKLLPYLMEGKQFKDAESEAGYRIQPIPEIKDKLDLLPKNSLRQPIVEKILNQLIHVVNQIIDPAEGLVTPEERKNGQFEIRIELARELKASKKEREKILEKIKKNEESNKYIAEKLVKEYNLPPNRKNITKWKLYHVVDLKESKSKKDNKKFSNEASELNGICLYCGKPFSLTEALTGENIDVDHIIPRAVYFDDSLDNKILVHSQCNRDKGNQTAYDYMKSKGEEALKLYIERVEKLYKIDEKKYEKKHKYLLMPSENIPEDFLNRDLRETAYISRKAKEILQSITANQIQVTSGAVTGKLRHLWGWNNILSDDESNESIETNIADETQSNSDDLTENQTTQTKKKRDDHRHHAIDALVIACTKQGLIQRINTLSSQEIQQQIRVDLKNSQVKLDAYENRHSLLEKYLISQKPFETHEVKKHVERILISSKPGKKVATWSKNIYPSGKIQKVLTPRGKLHDETYYGEIKVPISKTIEGIFSDYEKDPGILENIISPKLRELIEKRLADYNYDAKKAKKSLKQQPIYVDEEKKNKLEYVLCYETKFVYKIPVENILKDTKKLKNVVDAKVKEILANISKDTNKGKESVLYFNPDKQIPIRSVRVEALFVPTPLYPNKENTPYVTSGNNHHIAIYRDEQGNLQEHVCTFWQAVQRKLHGFPVIITDPAQLPKLISEAKEKLKDKGKDLPETFTKALPNPSWTFLFSMQSGEHFILELDHEQAKQWIAEKAYDKLSPFVYRVQKLSSQYYLFAHHTKTTADLDPKKSRRVSSLKALKSKKPIKIHLNVLGDIDHYELIKFE